MNLIKGVAAAIALVNAYEFRAAAFGQSARGEVSGHTTNLPSNSPSIAERFATIHGSPEEVLKQLRSIEPDVERQKVFLESIANHSPHLVHVRALVDAFKAQNPGVELSADVEQYSKSLATGSISVACTAAPPLASKDIFQSLPASRFSLTINAPQLASKHETGNFQSITVVSIVSVGINRPEVNRPKPIRVEQQVGQLPENPSMNIIGLPDLVAGDVVEIQTQVSFEPLKYGQAEKVTTIYRHDYMVMQPVPEEPSVLVGYRADASYRLIDPAIVDTAFRLDRIVEVPQRDPVIAKINQVGQTFTPPTIIPWSDDAKKVLGNASITALPPIDAPLQVFEYSMVACGNCLEFSRFMKNAGLPYTTIYPDNSFNDEASVVKWKQEKGLEAPALLSEFPRNMDFNGTPHIVVVDRNRTVIYTGTGFNEEVGKKIQNFFKTHGEAAVSK